MSVLINIIINIIAIVGGFVIGYYVVGPFLYRRFIK
jgi:uncharacterized protein YneF (UPF0154 family)